MTALTLGKFESIHRGHQALLRETVRRAKADGLTATAVTFDPHPRRVLSDPAYRPLFTWAERTGIIHSLGIDRLAAYVFDADFTRQEPEAFCERLFDAFHARALVLGEGYRFGRDRAGTTEVMRRLAEARGIAVYVARHVQDGEKKISTSDIRAYIERGKLTEAAALLGFPFFMAGTVIQGKRMGTRMGFPTANLIPPADKFLPPDGVYHTRTRIGGRLADSVTNLGLRPSFNDGAGRVAETYLLDFDGDLYGQTLQVDFLRFLRREQRFDSPDALRDQIARDVAAARSR